MGLRAKFNLVLLLVFTVGWLASGYVIRDMLYDNAKNEVVRQAQLMLETASSVRTYTATYINSTLPPVIGDKFMPQTVPAFAATETFNGIKKKLPGYVYREPTLNPTNPRDRAFDWEASLVNQFRASAELKELIGVNSEGAETVLYIARPLQIKNEKCLTCHSTTDVAPAALVRDYGATGGFGWKLNEIVGAQMVTVPVSIPYGRAEQTFRTFMLVMLLTFLTMVLLLNVMLTLLVVKPVRAISKQAEEISRGTMDLPELPEYGSDEISSLRKSFNRLRRSLSIAMNMLNKGR